MINNKQQTAMKLYTEEQVRQMIQRSNETGLTAEFLILTTTPIELPSDEEIKEVIKPFQNEMDDFDLGFRNGVQWLREKIQGGEQ
jgi:hypothetical protein